MAARKLCPNCGARVNNHPENGCVLAVLVQCIRDRATWSPMKISRIHAAVDADHLWNDVGRIVDNLEDGLYAFPPSRKGT